MNRTIKILVTALTTCMLMVSGSFGSVADAAKKPVVAEGLQGISVKGSTDLPGHFFLSFAFSRNLIMLDGKGNIVWSTVRHVAVGTTHSALAVDALQGNLVSGVLGFQNLRAR